MCMCTYNCISKDFKVDGEHSFGSSSMFTSHDKLFLAVVFGCCQDMVLLHPDRTKGHYRINKYPLTLATLGLRQSIHIKQGVVMTINNGS